MAFGKPPAAGPLSSPWFGLNCVSAGLVGTGDMASGWLAKLSIDVIICGAIALAALAGGAIWLRQQLRRRQGQVPNLSAGTQCDLGSCGSANQGKTTT